MMHEKLIAELEEVSSSLRYDVGDVVLQAAAAIREDAKTIEDLRAKLAKAEEAISKHKLCSEGNCNHEELDSIGFDNVELCETKIPYKCDMMDADDRLYQVLAALKGGE